MPSSPLARLRAQLDARTWGNVFRLVATGAVVGSLFNHFNPAGLSFSAAPAPAVPALATSTPAQPAAGVSGPADERPVLPPTTFRGADGRIAPTKITWPAAKFLVERGEAVLVDARPRSQFEAAHIPGAISLPEKSPAADLAAFAAGVPAGRRVIVYCSDQTCSASARLAQNLVDHHKLPAVHFMPGGIQEWQKGLAAGPAAAATDNAAPAPATARATSIPAPARAASRDYNVVWSALETQVRSGRLVIVDVRPSERFAAGHVENALSLPADATKEVFAAFAAKLQKSRPVILYAEQAPTPELKLIQRQLLEEHGLGAVWVAVEGYAGWEKLSAGRVPAAAAQKSPAAPHS